MGVSAAEAAPAADLPEDEYRAHEAYSINFTLEQVLHLAETIGVRSDQFWFPPPKTRPAPSSTPQPAAKKRARK